MYLTIPDILKTFPLADLILLINDEDDPLPLDFTDTSKPYVIRLTEIIESACSLVNSFVGAVYLLPINPIPSILKNYTYSIVSFSLYKRRQPSKIPSAITLEYKLTLTNLSLISKKRLKISQLTYKSSQVSKTYQDIRINANT